MALLFNVKLLLNVIYQTILYLNLICIVTLKLWSLPDSNVHSTLIPTIATISTNAFAFVIHAFVAFPLIITLFYEIPMPCHAMSCIMHHAWWWTGLIILMSFNLVGNKSMHVPRWIFYKYLTKTPFLSLQSSHILTSFTNLFSNLTYHSRQSQSQYKSWKC